MVYLLSTVLIVQPAKKACANECSTSRGLLGLRGTVRKIPKQIPGCAARVHGGPQLGAASVRGRAAHGNEQSSHSLILSFSHSQCSLQSPSLPFAAISASVMFGVHISTP